MSVIRMASTQPIVIRYSAGPAIGLGHHHRSRSLAEALVDLGAPVHFVAELDAVEPLPTGPTIPVDPGRPDGLTRYAEDVGARAIVYDTYAERPEELACLSRTAIPWLKFAWRPSGRCSARWIVAASPAAKVKDYRGVATREDAALLVGPRYAILRKSLADRVPSAAATTSQIASLVLSFGGGDDRGAIGLCLRALRGWMPDARIRVFVTSTHPDPNRIQSLVEERGEGRGSVHVDASDFLDQLARADLAVLAGGMTAFEAAALGVPALLVGIAENQGPSLRGWSDLGSATYVGDVADLRAEVLREAIDSVGASPATRRAMRLAGQRAVDGKGALRVARALLTAGAGGDEDV
jgi:spore coat polysaccharide biosynthesis predicted glycosyltransferase SpsG